MFGKDFFKDLEEAKRASKSATFWAFGLLIILIACLAILVADLSQQIAAQQVQDHQRQREVSRD